MHCIAIGTSKMYHNNKHNIVMHLNEATLSSIGVVNVSIYIFINIFIKIIQAHYNIWLLLLLLFISGGDLSSHPGT